MFLCRKRYKKSSQDKSIKISLQIFRLSSLFPPTHQSLEDGVVSLTESSGGVKLHHLPSSHHQHSVTVHDGVDPNKANTSFSNSFFCWTCWTNTYWLLNIWWLLKSNLWAMVRTVLPWNFSLMVCCSSWSVFWSTLAVASSIQRTCTMGKQRLMFACVHDRQMSQRCQN